MTRPHVEFIQSQALEWQPTALPHLAGTQCKVLSRDAESGACSLLLRCPEGWQLDGDWALDSEEEFLVLDGELAIGSARYSQDCYALLPSGSRRGAMQALRDNRLRLSAIGLSLHGRLAAVYTLAAALAGAAGALLAQTTGFASLDVFDFHRSADVMLALVIGGVGWLWGGIAGAVAFKVLHDLISAVTVQYWTFWIGLFLVVLMLVGRERLFRPWTWWRRSPTPT